MYKLIRSPRLDGLPVLLVFLVFAVCTLFVIALGGSIYKNTTTLTNENYEEQTCLSYVWTKVRTSDSRGRVYLEDFNGISSLCVEEEFGGATYKTLVYCYEGWLMELFYEDGLSFEPDAGMQVMSSEDLTFATLPGGLIKASSGGESLLIHIRSKAQARTE